MRNLLIAFIVLLQLGRAHAEASGHSLIDLNGKWQFKLDPQNLGEKEHWYRNGAPFDAAINVPGCWQAQGFGEPSGILRNSYCGTAWYRRSVSIPKHWTGKVALLRVGAAFRITDLFVNGVRVGEHDGFCTPFEFDISEQVKPGSENVIVFKVANPGRVISTSPGDQIPIAPTGAINYIGNWGGISGNVTLEARPRLYIEQVRIDPDISRHRAHFKIKLRNANSKTQSTKLAVEITGQDGVKSGGSVFEVTAQANAETNFEADLDIANAHLWTPDFPYLYKAGITLGETKQESEHFEERFGLREITTQGSVLLLNGKPLYLRGYGDDHVWVKTGVPPASTEVFRKQLKLTRSYGFNAVRFHSSVPVSQFFEAADEAGLLVLAELPAIYWQYFMPHTNYLMTEMDRVLDRYHNHPSFLSLAFGDELLPNPKGTEAEKKAYLDAIADFYKVAKQKDPKRLILSNDGNLMRPSDMDSVGDWVKHPKNLPTVPMIRHEFGRYWGSLPDLALAKQYDGCVIVPTWLASKKEWVDTNGLTKVYPQYLEGSQRLLSLGHKFQIESVRHDAEATGYEYWLGTDYPGGTGEGDSWEEGWFNCFWQPKAGESANRGRELNSAVLMMLQQAATRRTLWENQSRDFKLTISNYGERDIQNGKVRVRLKSGAHIISESQGPEVNIKCGEISAVGNVHLQIPTADHPEKVEVELQLTSATNRYLNRWDFWIFPTNALLKSSSMKIASDIAPVLNLYPFIHPVSEFETPNLLVTSNLTPGTVSFLRKGGRVLLLSDINKTNRKPNSHFFPAAGGGQGTWIQDCPALDQFPHDEFCDLQFFDLIEGAYACPLAGAPKDLAPLIGEIKTAQSWLSHTKNLAHSAYLFECKIGKGRLIINTLRLQSHLDPTHPEACFLLDCLLRYSSSDDFKPKVEVPEEFLTNLFGDSSDN